MKYMLMMHVRHDDGNEAAREMNWARRRSRT